MVRKKFNILAIDGGGIRGVYPAYILKRIQENSLINYSEYFDLIVGTSTGSIIASALAYGIPIEKVLYLYENRGKKIFKRNFFGFGGLIASKYSEAALEKQLQEVFGELKLSDAKTKLLIPATNIERGEVHVFKSPYRSDYVRDKNVKVADAVMASCSAPTYFNPRQVGPYLLADGGLWANNPALVGYIEAVGKLSIRKEDIKILSIGTGLGYTGYEINNHKKRIWGFLSGWNRTQLVESILSLQSQSAENMLDVMMPTDQCLRVNFKTDKKIHLDKLHIVDSLKSRADHDFSHNIKAINAFFS
jgi:uncharacterized protein